MGQENSEDGVALKGREVSSRKTFLRLGGAGLAAAALFVAPRPASAQTSGADVETYGVNSVAQLKATTPVANQRITALGYHSPGDGGGGLFRYVGNRNLPDNGGTTINSDDGVGQWLRVFEGPINARWFGARGDASVDDRAAVQAALDFASDGDVVHLPKGRYKVSQALTLARHGVTLDFKGIVEPHGSYSGYLLRLGSPALNHYTRPIHSSEYGNLDVINIHRLTLDGLHKSKGFTADRLDHFLWQNITCQRILGNGFKCSTLREADIINMTFVRCNAGSEPNFWIADELDTDKTNAMRFHDLTVVYCGGQAMKIGPSTFGTGRSRQISFYGTQLHYLAGSLSYANVDNNIKLIELLKTTGISFHGGNMRTGSESAGTVISLGDATHDCLNTSFHGVVMSGGGGGATGLDAVNAARVYWFGPDPEIPNGTAFKDPSGAILDQDKVLKTNAFNGAAPLSSYPMGTSTMFVTNASTGWPIAAAPFDVVTYRTAATAGEQMAFHRSSEAPWYKRGWDSINSTWNAWAELPTGAGGGASTSVVDGPFVTVPTPAQTLDANTTIDASKALSLFRANSYVTLRSVPNVAAGTSDGQRITLLNVGENSIKLQDQGTLRGSGLRLESSTLTLGSKGSVDLVYLGASGGWLQASKPVLALRSSS